MIDVLYFAWVRERIGLPLCLDQEKNRWLQEGLPRLPLQLPREHPVPAQAQKLKAIRARHGLHVITINGRRAIQLAAATSVYDGASGDGRRAMITTTAAPEVSYIVWAPSTEPPLNLRGWALA